MTRSDTQFLSAKGYRGNKRPKEGATMKKKGWEGDTPSGRSHGEKKGWGDSEMPPGLAKKSGEAKGKGKKKV